MTPDQPRQFFIQGQTLDGRTFRPSDWAERLAGAMSSFRPGGAKGGIGSFIGYSPYCVPRLIGGVKNVIVDERLKSLEPMAWDFVMNFGRDNGLMIVEGTLSPDGTFQAAAAAAPPAVAAPAPVVAVSPVAAAAQAVAAPGTTAVPPGSGIPVPK